jgi:enoyl-CoA hydratase/carnithine racemase
VDRAAADTRARVVVFRGRGNTFCSGADLDLLVGPVLGESAESLQLAIDSATPHSLTEGAEARVTQAGAGTPASTR